MRSTLFYIPADVAGLPVFGFGWLLLVWIALAIAVSAWLFRRPQGSREVAGLMPFFLIVAAVIAFLLPSIVEGIPGTQLSGLPIRGYGVMLMLATISAVALAAYRASQVGLDPEAIYSLAFVMFIAGILGARLFYLVEYWDQFVLYRSGGNLDVVESLKAMLNVTKGGLVVYGSVLLGVPAGIWFCRKRGLPVFAVGDIIAPSMVLGLALGRIGCFLNGCCFGGVCLTAPYALTFPAGSPPYLQQEEYGWKSGIWVGDQDGHVVVTYVAPRGPTSDAGLKPGDEITSINGARVESAADARDKLAQGDVAFEITTADGRVMRWLSLHGPARSVPIHPTQLYAAIDAGLLTSLLWFFYPYRRRDGEVFALLLTLHPLSRFFLEMIRSDEPGRFGTALTISQWLSLGILACGVALWIYIERGPRGVGIPAAVR